MTFVLLKDFKAKMGNIFGRLKKIEDQGLDDRLRRLELLVGLQQKQIEEQQNKIEMLQTQMIVGQDTSMEIVTASSDKIEKIETTLVKMNILKL